MIIDLPFSKTTMPLNLSDEIDYEVLESSIDKLGSSNKSEDKIVLDAMRNPIQSPNLFNLSDGKKNIVIICSDHTRPVPSKIIIPLMLNEIRKSNKTTKITLLNATGFHRGSSREELIEKFGEEIVDNEHIVVHDCWDEDNMTYLGKLPSGAPLYINKVAAEADLLLSEGFIETHFFAGFSGGRKSVLPGIAGRESVLASHCASFVHSKYCRTGQLRKNPMHKDMVAAAKMAKLQYIVNVIINSDKQIVAAFAGNPVTAHVSGCRLLSVYCSASPKKLADIAISTNGGYPLDQNMYQAVKGMTAAEAASKDGAVIIMVAGCSDGHGGESFYEKLANNDDKQMLMNEILSTKTKDTIPDQWEIQIQTRILLRHKVIYVLEPKHQQLAKDMGFEVADDVNQALERAFEIKGRDAHVAVIPDGVSVMIAK